MNYKEEDKKYIEASGRYRYYDFTLENIKNVVSQNIQDVGSDSWRMLIQMLYPTNMIGSGLFQPILIFRIGRNGKRIDPPIEAYDSIDSVKENSCLLSRIITYVEKNSKLKINSSWYEAEKKILGIGAKDE